MPASVRDLAMDWLYLGGMVFKGMDAAVELVAGIILLVITRPQLLRFVQAITAEELAEDPHDFLANLYLHEAASIDATGMLIGAVYLVVHGAVKLPMVVAVIRGSRRAYPWAVGILSALLLVQVVDLVVHVTIGVLVLSVLDAVIIALLVREWRHHRTFAAVWHARTRGLVQWWHRAVTGMRSVFGRR